jgi:hypothetical protein
MARATDDLLDELHGMQAEQLLAQIKKHKDEGEIIPPALFAQVNKFLKDNGVDRAVTPGDDIDLLSDEVPDFDNVVQGDF